jgi:hypothetical protein
VTITFRSAAVASNGAAPALITVSKPAGVVNGDVMVAFVVISADKTIVAGPSGWTLLDTQATGSATGDCRHAVYWRVASFEGSSYVWDFSGGADCAAAIVAYIGVGAVPVDTFGSRLMAGSTTGHTAPSVTTSTDTVAVMAYGTNPFYNGDTTFTTPSGLTVRGEADPGAGTTNRAVLKVFDLAAVGASPTGTKTTTLNNSAKGAAFTVGFKPSGAVAQAILVDSRAT